MNLLSSVAFPALLLAAIGAVTPTLPAQTIFTTTVDAGSVSAVTAQTLVGGNPAICYAGGTGLVFTRNSTADGSGAWTPTTVEAVFAPTLSLRVVAGNPAVAYYHSGTSLKFARAGTADGSGSWTVTPIAAFSGLGGVSVSLAIINGNPAIFYGENAAGRAQFARNSLPDGSGTWTVTNVAGTGTTTLGQFCSLNTVSGNPAASYFDATNGDLKFARAPSVNGTGTWTVTTVASVGTVGTYTTLLILGGMPVISYYDQSNGDLKFARNSAADGSGTWTVTTIESANDVGSHSSLAVVGGLPTISYYATTGGDLRIARNSVADGTGTWSIFPVETTGNVGQATSLVNLADGRAAISYYAVDTADLKWARVAFPPEIAVESPAGTSLASGGTRNVGLTGLGTPVTATVTIFNTGNENLTGLAATLTGADAADFLVTVPPATTVVGPVGSTTLTIQFLPVTSGAKTVVLHLASNDADENPFDLTLTGRGLSAAEDSDGDGLNDLAEFQLSALGFDWQIPQPSLVAALAAGANTAGLYTQTQLQALSVGTPLLTRDSGTGMFTLKIGLKKSTDLQTFSPFPLIPAQSTINPMGELEFTFSVPDNAAFFRLQTQP